MSAAKMYKVWLKMSREDLLTSKSLLEHGEADFIRNICFLCQQSAEKAIKGYLVFSKIEFSKTHDMEILLKQCVSSDLSFSKLDLGELDDYSVRIRYPDDDVDLDFEDAAEAVSTAERIYRFVESKITEKENLSLF